MALDFPSSPTNGQVYGNYYYDATVGAWNSFSSTVNPIPSTLKNLSVTTDNVGLVPFTVNGASGQTANLQNWKNSAGTIVASINNDGVISAATLNLNNDLTVANGGTGAGTFTTGAYLKGNGTSAIQAQTGIPFADVTMQSIGAGADLNTYVTQGLYHQSANVNAAGGANYPVPYAGLLEVFQSGTDGSGFTYQRYTAYKEQYGIWTRAKYTTTWTAWLQTPTGTTTVAQGGTGTTTLTSGGYLKGAGTAAITSQTGIPGGDITSGTVNVARLPAARYATGQGGQLTVSSTTPTTIASCSITTTGRPVLIIGTGNMNPIDASVWHRIYLYRDSSPIGNYTVIESRGASWNTAFALNHIEVPAAGTYTYSIRAALGSGQGQYGEESSAGAQISVIEL